MFASSGGAGKGRDGVVDVARDAQIRALVREPSTRHGGTLDRAPAGVRRGKQARG
jgi:hypothetical protein